MTRATMTPREAAEAMRGAAAMLVLELRGSLGSILLAEAIMAIPLPTEAAEPGEATGNYSDEDYNRLHQAHCLTEERRAKAVADLARMKSALEIAREALEPLGEPGEAETERHFCRRAALAAGDAGFVCAETVPLRADLARMKSALDVADRRLGYSERTLIGLLAKAEARVAKLEDMIGPCGCEPDRCEQHPQTEDVYYGRLCRDRRLTAIDAALKEPTNANR